MTKSAMSPVLSLQNILKPGHHFHFARTVVSTSHGFHGHDFAECFLIEGGTGIHRLGNRERKVSPGTLCFIGPGDEHGFTGEGLVIANIAFPFSDTMDFVSRYLDPLPAFFRRKETPREIQVPEALCRRISARLDRLGRSRTRYELDLFLLDFLALLGFVTPGSHNAGLPLWLEQVVAAASRPEVFRHGTRGLVEVSGHSAEHLARETRRHLGKTPTEIVNEGRLLWAARELETTRDEPSVIAEACGFSGPAHFYELFKKRFGDTPVRWRQASKRVFGG